MAEIKILGATIQLASDYIDIGKLFFLGENPRVYAVTHAEPGFDSLMREEQQEVIYTKLCQEPSVKNLIPEIRRHGGLMEPILVRQDTMEVIEGNSRLAAYRYLFGKEGGDWELVPCDIVSTLSAEQQTAFLNQIHVKGKTRWSAYEKANFAYVRKEQGWELEKIATVFGESKSTINTRVRTIGSMKKNGDAARSHFSYYDVLVRVPAISRAMRSDPKLAGCVLRKIKALASTEEESEFTAQELRKKLPVIIEKGKVLKKFVEGKVDLDEGYQLANISQVEERVRRAIDLLAEVGRQDVGRLEQQRFAALKQDVRKLGREATRIRDMVAELGSR